MKNGTPRGRLNLPSLLFAVNLLCVCVPIWAPSTADAKICSLLALKTADPVQPAWWEYFTPAARLYRKIQWKGPKPIWSTFKVIMEGDISDLFHHTHGEVLNQAVTDIEITRGPKVEYDLIATADPLDLELNAAATLETNPREAAEYRIKDANGNVIAIMERTFGGKNYHEMLHEIEILKVQLAVEKLKLTGQKAAAIEWIHVHPAEFFVLRGGGEDSFIVGPVNAYDVRSIQKIANAFPEIRWSVSALSGVRPENLVKTTFDFSRHHLRRD